MDLEHLLHLLREHLLASGVDAHRPTAEQQQRTVGLHGGEVARDRVADPVDDSEGLRRLLRILVVADRHVAADGHEPLLFRTRFHPTVVVGEHVDGGPELELRRAGRLALGRCGRAEPHRFRRAVGVDEQHVAEVLEQPILGLLAPHHARTRHQAETAQIPASRVGVQRLEERFGEGITDDDRPIDRLPFDEVEEFLGDERPVRVGHDAAAEHEHDQRGELPGAVHERARRDHHRAWADGASGQFVDRRHRRVAEERLPALTEHVEQVVLAPHHAFGHAGRPAGVEEQEVITADAPRTADIGTVGRPAADQFLIGHGPWGRGGTRASGGTGVIDHVPPFDLRQFSTNTVE